MANLTVDDILAASDDDSDDAGGNYGSINLEDILGGDDDDDDDDDLDLDLGGGGGGARGGGDGGGGLDLASILAGGGDDDDDDDDDNPGPPHPASNLSVPPAAAYTSSPAATPTTADAAPPPPPYTAPAPGNPFAAGPSPGGNPSSSSTRPGHGHSSRSSMEAHNAELEKILRADDDDDDDDDDNDHADVHAATTSSSASASAASAATPRGIRSGVTRTAANLQSARDQAVVDRLIAGSPSPTNTPALTGRASTTSPPPMHPSSASAAPRPGSQAVLSSSSSSSAAATSNDSAKGARRDSAWNRRSSSVNSAGSLLTMAEANVKRIFDSSKRNPERVLSPLAVKRMISARRQNAAAAAGGGDGAASGDGSSSLAPATAVGVIATSKLMGISRQLAKNAEYLQHGVGLPTTISIHAKFIAVGTTHGHVLVFDHFEEMRSNLGAKDGKSGAFGAVTSIDVCPGQGQDYLICGFFSGMVKLWDIMSGDVLKSVADAHAGKPVTGARFTRSSRTIPQVVTMDQEGCIMLVHFKKGMFSWSYEKLCLVANKGSPIVALDVLPQPPAFWSGRRIVVPQGTGDARHERALSPEDVSDMCRMMAFSTYTDSFIVSLMPRKGTFPARMLFKIPAPEDNNEAAAGAAAGAGDEVAGARKTQEHSCLAWGWSTAGAWPGDSAGAATHGGAKSRRPLVGAVLARAWGQTIELYAVDMVGALRLPNWSAKEDERVVQARSQVLDKRHVYRVSADAAARRADAATAVAVQWLNVDILLFMDSDFNLCVLNAGSGTLNLLERISVSAINMVYWTPRVQAPASATQDTAAAAKRSALQRAHGAKSFQHTFRACDGCLYLLGRRELQVARVQTWQERVRQLKSAGDWIEALLLALDRHIEIHGALPAAKDGGAGSSVAPRGPFVKHKDDADIADLLMEYVDISLGGSSHVAGGTSSESSSAAGSLGYFKIIGKVCIDYCSSIKRTDLLFSPIFDRFRSAAQDATFVELLQPYIMDGRLTSLPARVIKTLVTHYSQNDMDEDLERCILRLDPREMDLDNLVKLCRTHRLFDALIYIFNRGLMDYITPLEDILGPMDPNNDQTNSSPPSDFAEKSHSAFVKALLYISYTLSGHAYPTGELEPGVAKRARLDMIQFMARPASGRGSVYPRVLQLLRNDAAETLALLELIFHEDEDETASSRGLERTASQRALRSSNAEDEAEAAAQQDLFNALIMIERGCAAGGAGASSPILLKPADAGMLAVFLCEQYALGDVDLTPTDAVQLVKSLITGVTDGTATPESMSHTEDVLVDLAHRVVREQLAAHKRQALRRGSVGSVDTDDDAGAAAVQGHSGAHTAWETHIRSMLQLAQQASMKRVSGVLFEQVGDMQAVIEAYLDDEDVTYGRRVFDYIEKCARDFGAGAGGTTATSHRASPAGDGGSGGLEGLRSTVLSLLPGLTKLERNRAARVVLVLFPDQHEQVIQKLHDPWLQFNYLQQLMNASLGRGSSSSLSSSPSAVAAASSSSSSLAARRAAAPLIKHASSSGVTDLLERSGISVTPDMHKLYIKLLCQFEKESVLRYLKSNDQYPIDECLRLCEKYDVSEARAYLLERTGDVHGAMTHLLRSMDTGLAALRLALADEARLARLEEEDAKLSPRAFRARSASRSGSIGAGVSAMPPSGRVAASMRSASAMAQRRGAGTRPPIPPIVRALREWQTAEACTLELVGLCERNSHLNLDGAQDINQTLWFTLLDALVAHRNKAKAEDEDEDDGFALESLRMVLADFVHIVLTNMNGHVALPAVLAKITSDHSNQKFREFRSTITGMLENVRYEQNILHTAKQLLADAKFRQVRDLHRGKAHHIKNIVLERGHDAYGDRGGGLGDVNGGGAESAEAAEAAEAAATAKRIKARLRRLQRGRRRATRSHPVLFDVMRELDPVGYGSDSDDSNSDDMGDDEGETVIPYGHLVLGLEPRSRVATV